MANEVSVEITVEEKAALKALAKLSKGFQDVEKKAEKSIKDIDKGLVILGKKMSGFSDFAKKNMEKMTGAMSVAAGTIIADLALKAFGALKNSMAEVIEASQRQEDAINALNASLRQSGEFSQNASEDMQAFASSLQKVTKFGDEAIMEQLAFAKSMGATIEQSKKIVKAATDMSAALNMDFNSAVRNITKTLGGLKGELGESIPELGKFTAEQLKAGDAIGFIADKFQGQATSATETYRGKTAQLTNAWGDLLEKVGDYVTKSPAVLSVIDKVTGAISDLNDLMREPTRSEQLDEARSNYEKITAEMSRLKKEMADIREEGGLFESFKLNDKIKEYERLRKLLPSVTGEMERLRLAEKAADQQEADAKDKDKKDPAQDARILYEKQVAIELAAIKEQQRLETEEAKLKQKEIEGTETEADLERLRAIEREKGVIALDAEIAKNKLKEDGYKKDLEADKLQAKKKLEVAKMTAKQEVEAAKKAEEQKALIQKTAIQTTQNFLQAGITLAKQGSAEQKALLTADALVSTYAAANKALTSPPGPPWSFALAASTVAMGLANVAKINKQSFATGGVVGGFNGASIGLDNTTANVRTGEMVLNPMQQRRLFEIATTGEDSGSEGIAMAVQQMAEQPIVVQVDGIEVARAVRNAKESGFNV
jgi:hypothetical protein